MVFKASPDSEPLTRTVVHLMTESVRSVSAPPALRDDLILALIPMWQDRSGPAGPAGAQLFWSCLTQHRRWRFLVRRLEAQWRSLERERPRPGQSVHAETGTQRFLRQFSVTAATVLASLHAELNARGLSMGDSLAFAEEKVEAWAADLDTSASFIVTDELLATIEITARTGVLRQVDMVVDQGAVRGCLRQPWYNDEFEVRLLNPDNREGDYAEVLPGDFGGVRGITKKLRDEQIPKILPSEYAAWTAGSQGRLATLDKIINRSPPCLEHYDTRSPYAQHELLIVMSLFGTHESARLPAAEQTALGMQQRIELRACAFQLLAHAAMKVPANHVRADVLWLEGFHEGHCLGSTFPLTDLHSATAAHGMGWRNVAELDRVVPDVFMSVPGAARPAHRYGTRRLTEKPAAAIRQLVSRRSYAAVCFAGIAPRQHLARTLPMGVTQLPSPGGVPSVLLASVEPRQGGDPMSADEGAWQCHAAVHPNVLSATVSPGNLEPVTRRDLVRSWLWMLIGPTTEAHATPQLMEQTAR